MGQLTSEPEPPKPISSLPPRPRSAYVQQQQRPVLITFQQQQNPFNYTNSILSKTVPKTVQIQEPKQKVKQLSKDQILTQVLCIAMEDKEYDECWQKFTKLLQPFMKFKFVMPNNVTAQGEELLKNGCFIAYWLIILQKNNFLNFEIIFKCVEKEYLPKIDTEKKYLMNFLEIQKARLESRQIDKQEKTKENLKRISFKSKTKEQRKRQIRSGQGFVLDFLQINDIYLLQEVETIGIINQIGDFIVVLARIKANNKEQICVGVKNNKVINSSSSQSLRKIQKDYEGIAYLEFEGMQMKGWNNNKNDFQKK